MALFGYRAGAYQADESFDSNNAERLHAARTLLLGRRTYEQFRGYWPSAGNDPGATPISREIARLNNAMEKIVVSDTLPMQAAEAWRNTSVVRRAEARERITGLKRGAGGDILVFGSRTLWNRLLADELHVMIAPILLGGGTRLFDGRPAASLRLIGSRTRDGSGNVLAQYSVRPAGER